jgi:hypothetical protein
MNDGARYWVGLEAVWVPEIAHVLSGIARACARHTRTHTRKHAHTHACNSKQAPHLLAKMPSVPRTERSEAFYAIQQVLQQYTLAAACPFLRGRSRKNSSPA